MVNTVNKKKKQKVALVHDYLKEAGGAERVLRVLADMYPEATIYTSFVVRNSRVARMFSSCTIIESKWGWLLKIGKMYSYLRFLQPLVWKSLDLSTYDLVITSCSGYIARGFRVSKKTKVIAYCHTPPKWLYGYETPTRASGKWWGKMYLWVWGPLVRYFDYHSAQRVDKWMANSCEVARRIKKFYRRDAVVVYPPVEISVSACQRISVLARDYYLVVGRLVGAKGLGLAVEACKEMKRRLVVVGEGIVNSEQRTMNSGREVEYTGWVSDKELVQLYVGAKGYLALAIDEDFGMTVVEAISQGTPVVALASGGYIETVSACWRAQAGQCVGVSVNQKGKKQIQTGILVNEFTVDGVVAGMKRLEKTKWDREKMKKSVKKYGRSRFEKQVRGVVGA